MVSSYPIGVLVVPPFAIVPTVLLIIGAILIEPPRVERGPILMIVIEPIGIVVMPPVSITPQLLVVVFSPLGFGGFIGPVISD